MGRILADIRKLRADGVSIGDIFVNAYDERWGETCAVSRADAIQLIEAWKSDGCETEASLDELESASDWLDKTGNTL